eukprot:CAMPEP_0175808348 /NCGR_PEP_ID=MMETSP0107_2-20121207/2209_1 /TAXON_ID=195067 ORGANISM="Goniomonas pacifica, Strain CCMP1869" /NCGR_SAMPLE_ID=MMETSP0107_2 /ASSEMBLY_ACC=CAM_ASM_000203 /LENGTH=75 /DNA_ID=CAMNT_0017119965 /DNA_START=94 /DNA_END=321 /DNA_ORIENTATION=+
MGGQGARRSRNWRHNRPGSPYFLSRFAKVGGPAPSGDVAKDAEQAVSKQAVPSASDVVQQAVRGQELELNHETRE